MMPPSAGTQIYKPIPQQGSLFPTPACLPDTHTQAVMIWGHFIKSLKRSDKLCTTSEPLALNSEDRAAKTFVEQPKMAEATDTMLRSCSLNGLEERIRVL